MQVLWFLHSAPHLMLTDIYMKFCDNSSNGFQVIVKIQVLWFLRSATCLILTDIYMKFHEDSLKGVFKL